MYRCFELNLELELSRYGAGKGIMYHWLRREVEQGYILAVKTYAMILMTDEYYGRQADVHAVLESCGRIFRKDIIYAPLNIMMRYIQRKINSFYKKNYSSDLETRDEFIISNMNGDIV